MAKSSMYCVTALKEVKILYYLMPFKLGALDEGLAALGTDVNSGPVGVQVFPHGRVVAEHLRAPFVRAGDRARDLVARLPFRSENWIVFVYLL